MIKRRLLSYDIPQLTKVFKKDFPQLVTMAEESESAALFKEALRSFVFSRIDRTVGGSNMGNAVAKRILLLIEHDGMMVSELSTGEEMPIRTITCLWQFLAGKLEEDLKVKNLLLYHTEDKTLNTRKACYTEEAAQGFSGVVHVPDDLEIIDIIVN